MRQITYGEYLEGLGVYNSGSRTANWDKSLNVHFQRALLPLERNDIKRRMARDLLRGGTIPAIVTLKRDGNRSEILDGLQRSHVQMEVLNFLLNPASARPWAQQMLADMKRAGQSPITLEQFLERPLVVQEWENLTSDETVRLFIILNAAQQRVADRWLLEVMGADLRQMFEGWGIRVATDREERESRAVRKPRRRGADDSDVEVDDEGSYPFGAVLAALIANAGRNPQILPGSEVKERIDSPRLELDMTLVGSDASKQDFTWACREFDAAIQHAYADADAQWRGLLHERRGRILIPLMAALADARRDERARGAIQDRQEKLTEIVRAGAGEDPLWITSDSDESLSRIFDSIKASIGRKRRSVVYHAFRRYFRQGPIADSGIVIDWRGAYLAD
jgi:hypothetical protein